MACVIFSIRATSCTVAHLVKWWTDRANGPVAEDAESYLAAFPPCNEVSFSADGTVTISVNSSPTAQAGDDEVVSYPPSEDRRSKAEDVAFGAAQALQLWMEDVTSRLQQLYCLDCGLEVFSQATCCCSQHVRSNLSAYRVHPTALHQPPSPSARFHGASDEAIHKRWKQVETAAAVACHTHCVLAHSDAAKAVQDQLIQWFNQQPSENSYATVIWPRKNCPWAVSSRHLQSNIVDRGLCAIPSLQPSYSFCSQPSNSFCSIPIPNPSFTNFENQPLRIAPAATPPPPHPDNQYNKVMTDMFKEFVRQQQKLDAASPWATASPAFVNIQSICPHLDLNVRSEADAMFSGSPVSFKTPRVFRYTLQLPTVDIGVEDMASRKLQFKIAEYIRHVEVNSISAPKRDVGFIVIVGHDGSVAVFEQSNVASCWMNKAVSYWQQKQGHRLSAFQRIASPYGASVAERGREWLAWKQLCARLPAGADPSSHSPPDYRQWHFFAEASAEAARNPIPPPPAGFH